MVEQFILQGFKNLIRQGEEILEWQEGLPHVYDMPVIDEGTLERYKAQYKEWRSAYDEIITQLDKRGVIMNISRISANDERLRMYLNVRDIHEQNRNITNALTKHIEELTEVLEGIDYVEIDAWEQIERFKQMYRYDDKKACEEFKNYVLELLMDNPRKRYVLDVRKMNIGDYDLLENIGQILTAPISKKRIWIEHRTMDDANILKNHLRGLNARIPVHIDVQARVVEHAIILNIEY